MYFIAFSFNLSKARKQTKLSRLMVYRQSYIEKITQEFTIFLHRKLLKQGTCFSLLAKSYAFCGEFYQHRKAFRLDKEMIFVYSILSLFWNILIHHCARVGQNQLCSHVTYYYGFTSQWLWASRWTPTHLKCLGCKLLHPSTTVPTQWT